MEIAEKMRQVINNTVNGDGNDTIKGGLGNDTLNGDNGNDGGNLNGGDDNEMQ